MVVAAITAGLWAWHAVESEAATQPSLSPGACVRSGELWGMCSTEGPGLAETPGLACTFAGTWEGSSDASWVLFKLKVWGCGHLAFLSGNPCVLESDAQDGPGGGGEGTRRRMDVLSRPTLSRAPATRSCRLCAGGIQATCGFHQRHRLCTTSFMSTFS